jgi:cold shock CspA family protein
LDILWPSTVSVRLAQKITSPSASEADIFVHGSALPGSVDTLNPNQVVIFDVEKTKKSAARSPREVDVF